MEEPKVGVGVILIRDGCVLLGKRKNSHGEGSWAFPGGGLNFTESPEDCAKREVKEETDIDVFELEHFAFTSDFFEKEQKHYVTLFLRAKRFVGEPKLREPDKCQEWKWFSMDQLPEPKFLPLRDLLKQKKIPWK